MTDPSLDADSPAGHSCRLELDLARSPEQLWPYLAEHRRLEEWCCPNPELELDVESEPVEGGALVISMGGRYTARGRYLEVEEPRRLVATWSFDEEEDVAESVLAYELAPNADGSTRLTLVHSALADADAVEEVEEGWELALGRLEALLEEG